MEYILTLQFNCVNGQKSTLSIDNVKPAITQAELDTLMNSIISNNIFATKNGDFVTKANARVTEKTVTDYTF